MAHNLMKTEKGYAYAGALEPAWHKLGITVDNIMTSKEAIKLAQLDYEVGIEKLYADIDGQQELIRTHNVTYNKNTNRVFGVVGQRYEVIQNSEAFTFLDAIVGEGSASYHTAGALGFGETIFITVKLPNNIRMKSNPNEVIENYLLFTSSHDGSGAIQVLHTPIRVVCNNTLNAALSMTNGKNKWSIKHTKNARNRLSGLEQLFINVNDRSTQLGNWFDAMFNKKLTSTDITNLTAKIVLNKDEYIIENGIVIPTTQISTKKSNLIYSIKKSIYTGVGSDLIEVENAYGFYQGVTNYLENEKRYKSYEDKFKNVYTKNNLSNKAIDEIKLLLND